MAVRDLLRRICHTGLAAHTAHHLMLELIENFPRNLRIPKLSGLFLGQTPDHSTQK
jgi:hypothetical protein